MSDDGLIWGPASFIRMPFDDLPGISYTEATSAFGVGPDALLIEQDLGAQKIAGWVPVSSAWETNEITLLAEAELAGIFRPWLRPDRNPFPSPSFFPAIDRATERVRMARVRARTIRRRITDAVDVLRHGLTEGDDW